MSITTIHPASCGELADFLKQNATGEKRSVVPVGGGTSLNFGRAVSAEVQLHTGQLARVLDYPARDMTITVEAGLPLETLSEILREERQQIPVDFSQADQATVGGAIAANAFGPRRFGQGTLRDWVIGITAVDAGGRTFKAGGRVVKNVAGYDLCKLMVGSWGTLAVLTEVTLKVTPLPETMSWVWSAWDSPAQIEAALAGLLTSETRPLAVEVFSANLAESLVQSRDHNWPTGNYVLAVLVAGSEKDVAWQAQKLTEECSVHRPADCTILNESVAGELLQSLLEWNATSAPLTFRAHLLPSRVMEFLEHADKTGFMLESHAGNGIVIGKAGDDLSTAEDAWQQLKPLRELAEAHQGSFILLDCPLDWKTCIDVFGAAHSAWPLMRNLKQSLDPQNLLSPGRLFAPPG